MNALAWPTTHARVCIYIEREGVSERERERERENVGE